MSKILLKSGGYDAKYGCLSKSDTVGETLPISPSKTYSNSLYDTINPYLVACWNFDKDLTSDSKGTNTLTNNGVTAVAGKNNNGASFNSTYSTAAYSTDFNFSGTTSFSISFWFQSSNVAANHGYISDRGLDYAKDQFFIRSYQSNLHVLMGQDGTATLNNNNITLSNDTWYHGCLVRDGNTLHLCVNAIDKSVEYTTSLPSTTYGLVLGRIYRDAVGAELVGKMDEILILKGYALSQAQITELYNNGLGKYYRKKSGVIHHA